MQIRLLGGVTAAADDGDPIDVGPAKCQAVLAALALSAGSAVPVSRIVALVWGEEPPRTAEKTLQSYVTRLRKGLGPDSIVRSGAAYRLDVDPAAVDVLRFHQLLDAGEVDDALAEWTGTPLAGLDAEGLAATVDALVELWLGAVEVDLARQVETDSTAAIGTLTELTATHPFREGLWALLMTALYRVGRQADALAAYRSAREHLVEELGVEPGPRLRELEGRILGQDEELAVDRRRADPAAIPSGTVTFAFTDIEGSARKWAADRDQTAVAVARHDQLVHDSADGHDGYVFATAGDSFGVAFSRAGAAAAWAAELQQAMRDEPWPASAELRVRIGLHTGEAEERGDDYFGPAVNVASRIAAAGHGGQTLVSDVTAALFDAHDLRDLGRYRLDGAVADHGIFQLGDGDHPPLRVDGGSRGNLPRRSGRLIGRDESLEVVIGALTEAPVVTLVGPGGIGKTRLALAAAHLATVDFADGAWLVELADIASSDEVSRAVADALDVKESPGRSLAESVVAHLRTRHALLVLDNCEHVVDGAADLVGRLADDCPGVHVVATSREGLGHLEERLIAVGPLDPTGAAVELFDDRASAADASYDPDDDRETIGEICRRLDGVPLAIELAAARTRSLAPADLVERLDDQLRLLGGGRRRSVERHRTLRATIQWSYDLLSPDEQMLFRRLSIFAGSFDLAAAEAVAADAELDVVDVDDLLGCLVERSMLGVESGAYGRRFRLLETMRQFGAEYLAEAGTSDAMARRHADFVVGEVERLGELLNSLAEAEGAALLGELWPNLRAAVDWATATEDVGLVAALLRPVAPQVFARRGTGEIADRVERLLELAGPGDDPIVVDALVWASFHCSMTQDRARFADLVERAGEPDHLLVRYARMCVDDADDTAVELGLSAAAEMRAEGQEQIASMFEVFVGAALLNTGRLDEADAHLEVLARRFRSEGPPSLLNWTLYLLGTSAAFGGDADAAERLYDETASISVPPRTNSANETLEARAAFRRGAHAQAFGILRAYIDELLEADNMAGTGVVGIEFVNMMTAVDRLSDAGLVLGHFDATGVMGVEGPGFKLFVADAVEIVAADPSGSAARRDAAAREPHEREVLLHMRGVLDDLLVDPLG